MKDNLYKFIILILTCVLTFNYLNHKRHIKYNNQIYSEKLKEYKDLNDSIYIMKDLIVLNNKELKYLNDSLHQLVKTLRDKPIYISKTSTELNRSYHLNPDTVLKTSYIYKDNYTNIKLYNDSIPKVHLNIYTDLYFNVIEKDKRLYTTVRFSNPDIKIKDLNGYLYNLNKSKVFKNYTKRKDKKFGLGFYIGYGFTCSNLKPSIGISLNYNIFKF